MTKLQPDIAVAPAELVFETVPWGSRTKRTLKIANRGDGLLSVTGIRSQDAAFVVDEFTGILRPSEQAEIDVWFESGDTGVGQTQLLINSDDLDTPTLEVPLRAVRRDGPILAVCYQSDEVPLAETCTVDPVVDFGAHRLGERRRVRLLLRSEAEAPLTIDSIAIEGGFVLDGRSNAITLAHGETHAVEVSFTPADTSNSEGNIRISSNDQGRPIFDIPLLGRGEKSPLCIEPNILDFGVVPLGSVEQRTLSVTNCGEESVEIIGAAIQAGPFSIPAVQPTTLPVGAALSLGIEVTYNPQAQGRDEARLRLDTAMGPAFVDVRGGAAECVIRPPERVELVAKLGETVEQVVRIDNPGTGTCTLTDIALSHESRQITTTTVSLPFELQGQSTLELLVRYRPLDLVRDEMSLRIASTSEVQPLLVLPVVGEPVEADEPCEAFLIPTPLHFGVLEPGEQRSAGIVLTDSEGPCAITDVALSTDHPDIELLPIGVELPHLMKPFEMMVFGIRYSASTESEVFAVLRVEINAFLPALQAPIGGRSEIRRLCIDQTSVEAPATLRAEACGDKPVTVTHVGLLEGRSGLTTSPLNASVTLSPGQVLDIDITHDGITPVQDDLIIESDDPALARVRVPVTAGPVDLPVAGHLLFNRAAEQGFGQIGRYTFRGEEQELFSPAEAGTNCVGCHVSSPDGRFVISESHSGSFHLAAFDRQTGQELHLAHLADEAVSIAFNPDVDTDPPYQYVYSHNGDLHIASLTAGYLRVLDGANTPNLSEGYPAWSVNDEIAFASAPLSATFFYQMAGQTEIFLVDSAGGTPRSVPAASANGVAPYYPDFSPDGRFLALTVSAAVATEEESTFAASDAQIRVVDLEAGVSFDLAAANGADGATSMARFSSDGRHLAFSSNRAGSLGAYDLFVAEFDAVTGLDQAAIPLSAVNSELSEHFPSWER